MKYLKAEQRELRQDEDEAASFYHKYRKYPPLVAASAVGAAVAGETPPLVAASAVGAAEAGETLPVVAATAVGAVQAGETLPMVAATDQQEYGTIVHNNFKATVLMANATWASQQK